MKNKERRTNKDRRVGTAHQPKQTFEQRLGVEDPAAMKKTSNLQLSLQTLHQPLKASLSQGHPLQKLAIEIGVGG